MADSGNRIRERPTRGAAGLGEEVGVNDRLGRLETLANGSQLCPDSFLAHRLEPKLTANVLIPDEEGTMDTTATGAQLQPDDAAQIRATIEPWTKACLDRDWDALLAMCTEDIVISGPGGPKVSGDAVRPWLENYPVMKTMAFDFDRMEISGDLAVANGSGSMMIEVEGQEASMVFDFTDVLRKQHGTWLYSSVVFNSKDAPA